MIFNLDKSKRVVLHIYAINGASKSLQINLDGSKYLLSNILSMILVIYIYIICILRKWFIIIFPFSTVEL